jgi:hypothetical protein
LIIAIIYPLLVVASAVLGQQLQKTWQMTSLFWPYSMRAEAWAVFSKDIIKPKP